MSGIPVRYGKRKKRIYILRGTGKETTGALVGYDPPGLPVFTLKYLRKFKE
jgi:hypothetical protein